MKLFKLQCSCDLILSSSNNYDNACIDDKLLTLLYSTKSHIDQVSQEKWEKFKKLHKHPVEKLKKHTEKVLTNVNLTAEEVTFLTEEITGTTRNLSDTKEQRKYEYSRRIIGLTSGFTSNDSRNAIEESLYRSFGEKPFNFGIFEKANSTEVGSLPASKDILRSFSFNLYFVCFNSSRSNLAPAMDLYSEGFLLSIYSLIRVT